MLTIARNDSGEILPLIVFELEDVMISSASMSVGKDGGIPLENVTLNFTKITWTYSAL
ncbi:MAG TPA: type VI secretion system tube protein Hcp, partial [Candidatus Latescibacteria bacterium]|nr:type VI secretion system tube protein Hcp [Candidatus Latescibacterota bacterium]